MVTGGVELSPPHRPTPARAGPGVALAYRELKISINGTDDEK